MTRVAIDPVLIHAIADDVVSAFGNVLKAYYDTPELVQSAGYKTFAEWAEAQPKPQLQRSERKQLAAEYTSESWGMTQREAAAVLGVTTRTVERDLSPTNVGSTTPSHEEDEPTNVGSDAEPADALPDSEDEDDALDDTVSPQAVANSNDMYLSDIRYYLKRALNIAPPPQVDPALFKRIRRGLVPALYNALDKVAGPRP